ncbi:MAG: dephospho-CoA kinase [Gammaproteobacteria bacterium]|nr:dephospho-CoA kinase [Gammaproteobacteria bacterium]
MLVIGLTGGIGSGKSTVADMFADLGVPVIDTDIIARDLVMPGQTALEEITALFGNTVLNSDGSLNRKMLRELVFNSDKQRQQLEAVLHPRIREQVQRQLDALSVAYCIIVIPLLLETGQQNLVQRILVIDTPEELQIKRSAKRDSTPEENIKKIVATQVERQKRLAAADDIIHNDNSIAHLKQQILDLHRFYSQLASH